MIRVNLYIVPKIYLPGYKKLMGFAATIRYLLREIKIGKVELLV